MISRSVNGSPSIATASTAPMKGAVVRVGSRHCTTRAAGTCAITFPATFAKGKHTVRIKKPSYGIATVVVRVR